MSAPADNTPQYKRIRWQNGGSLSRGSLWLADDHMLQITSYGIQERYRRFYLGDIKAFMIGEAYSSVVMGIVLGIITFFIGILAFVSTFHSNPTGAVVVAWILFLAMIGLTILALCRGRTVKVYVVTELQTVLLRSVARKWQADKLVAQLTPLINAAQANLVRVEPTMAEQIEVAVDAAVEATSEETSQNAASDKEENA